MRSHHSAMKLFFLWVIALSCTLEVTSYGDSSLTGSTEKSILTRRVHRRRLEKDKDKDKNNDTDTPVPVPAPETGDPTYPPVDDEETDAPSYPPLTDAPSYPPGADAPSYSPGADAPSVSPVADAPSVSPVADVPSVSPTPFEPIPAPIGSNEEENSATATGTFNPSSSAPFEFVGGGVSSLSTISLLDFVANYDTSEFLVDNLLSSLEYILVEGFTETFSNTISVNLQPKIGSASSLSSNVGEGLRNLQDTALDVSGEVVFDGNAPTEESVQSLQQSILVNWNSGGVTFPSLNEPPPHNNGAESSEQSKRSSAGLVGGLMACAVLAFVSAVFVIRYRRNQSRRYAAELSEERSMQLESQPENYDDEDNLDGILLDQSLDLDDCDIEINESGGVQFVKSPVSTAESSYAQFSPDSNERDDQHLDSVILATGADGSNPPGQDQHSLSLYGICGFFSRRQVDMFCDKKIGKGSNAEASPTIIQEAEEIDSHDMVGVADVHPNALRELYPDSYQNALVDTSMESMEDFSLTSASVDPNHLNSDFVVDKLISSSRERANSTESYTSESDSLFNCSEDDRRVASEVAESTLVTIALSTDGDQSPLGKSGVNVSATPAAVAISNIGVHADSDSPNGDGVSSTRLTPSYKTKLDSQCSPTTTVSMTGSDEFSEPFDESLSGGTAFDISSSKRESILFHESSTANEANDGCKLQRTTKPLHGLVNFFSRQINKRGEKNSDTGSMAKQSTINTQEHLVEQHKDSVTDSHYKALVDSSSAISLSNPLSRSLCAEGTEEYNLDLTSLGPTAQFADKWIASTRTRANSVQSYTSDSESIFASDEENIQTETGTITARALFAMSDGRGTLLGKLGGNTASDDDDVSSDGDELMGKSSFA